MSLLPTGQGTPQDEHAGQKPDAPGYDASQPLARWQLLALGADSTTIYLDESFPGTPHHLRIISTISGKLDSWKIF